MTYIQDKSLVLQLQYKAEDSWTECFSLQPTDSLPLKMPNAGYLGFSAETGELSDNFDIISVDTRNLYTPAGSGGRKDGRPGRGRATKTPPKSGGWGWFFVKIILFVLVAGGCYVGFTVYRTNKRHSRF